MKATGIVRRIDDLGRVVIPKEIRRTMRIREGAPLQTTYISATLDLEKHLELLLSGKMREYLDNSTDHTPKTAY